MKLANNFILFILFILFQFVYLILFYFISFYFTFIIISLDSIFSVNYNKLKFLHLFIICFYYILLMILPLYTL
jgi:hypothetical protein